MHKIIIILLFITTSIYATPFTKQCQNNLKNMSSFYYTAIQLKDNKHYKESINSFHKSIKHANESLNSCQNNTNFDFRVPYDYIVSAEFEIQKIENQ